MAKSKFQTRLGSGSGVRASAVPKTANKKATGSSQQASKLTQTTLAFHAPSQSASTQPVASSSTAVAKAKLLDRKSEKVSWENSEQTQSQPPAKRQRISLRPQPPPSCSSSTKDKGKQRARPVAQESLPAESFVELSQFQCAFNTSNVDGFPQHIAHIGYVEKTISPVKQKQRPRSSQAEPVARKPTVVLELEDVETEEDEDEQEAGQVVSLPKAVNADDSGIGFGAEGTEVELPPELPSQEPATSQFSSGPVSPPEGFDSMADSQASTPENASSWLPPNYARVLPNHSGALKTGRPSPIFLQRHSACLHQPDESETEQEDIEFGSEMSNMTYQPRVLVPSQPWQLNLSPISSPPAKVLVEATFYSDSANDECLRQSQRAIPDLGHIDDTLPVLPEEPSSQDFIRPPLPIARRVFSRSLTDEFVSETMQPPPPLRSPSPPQRIASSQTPSPMRPALIGDFLRPARLFIRQHSDEKSVVEETQFAEPPPRLASPVRQAARTFAAIGPAWSGARVEQTQRRRKQQQALTSLLPVVEAPATRQRRDKDEKTLVAAVKLARKKTTANVVESSQTQHVLPLGDEEEEDNIQSEDE